MSPRTTIGLLVLAVVVTALSYLEPLSRGAPVAIDRSPDDGAEEVTSEATSGPSAAEPSGVREADGSSSTTGWFFAGHVTKGWRTPFPGVRLLAELFAGYETTGPRLARAEVAADASGRFVWRPRRLDATVTIRLSSPDRSVRLAPITRTVVRGREPPHDIEVRAFPIDARLTGRVTDLSDRPIAGANVQALIRTEGVFCDEAGRFELDVSSRGGRTMTLRCAAPGYALLRTDVERPKAGASADLHLRLAPGLRLRGRVVDEDGRPVEGARVTSFQTSFYKSVVTDVDGRFEIGYLERGRRHDGVYARKPGYVEARVDIDTTRLQASYELVLKHGVRLDGMVVGPNGAPVAGAKLYIGTSSAHYNRLDAMSRDDGGFVFAAVAPGVHDIVTEAPGFASDLRKLTVPGDGVTVTSVRIDLGAAHYLAGRVVDGEGVVIPGVGVHARVPKAKDLSGDGRYIGEQTVTGVDGRFRLDDLPGPKIAAEFYGGGVQRVVKDGLEVDREDLEIVVERRGVLHGRVVDGVTGKPIERFEIRRATPELREGEREGSWFGTRKITSADGSWSFTVDEAPGAVFGVEATAKGYAPVVVRRAVAVVDGEIGGTRIELFRGGSITGRVVEAETGKAIAAARVRVFSRERPLDDAEDSYPNRTAVFSDAEGRFRMEGVVGEVSVAVTHPSWPVTLAGPFVVAPDAALERMIHVKPGARLSGKLVDPDGQPLANTKVRFETYLVPGQTHRLIEKATDAGGRFEFSGRIATGSYKVSVWPTGDPPYVVYARLVELVCGESKDIVLAPSGTGELKGTITGSMAVPKAMALMFYRAPRSPDEGRELTRFWSRAKDGKIHVRGLPTGDYTVQASDWQEKRVLVGNARFEIEDGKTTTVVIVLSSHKR